MKGLILSVLILPSLLLAAGGDVFWQYKTDNIIQTSPAQSKGVVYFSNSLGNLYALYAQTGKVKPGCNSIRFDTSKLNSAVYFIKYNLDKEKISTKRLLHLNHEESLERRIR